MAYDRQYFVVDQSISSSDINQIEENVAQVRSQHKGPSAPPQAVIGSLWLDDSTDKWAWKVYTGTEWAIFAKVDNEDKSSLSIIERYATDASSPVISTISFDVTTSLAANQWESIGPTGSGADNIWTALDDIPESANYIEIKATMFADNDSISANLSLWARKFGSVDGTENEKLIGKIAISTLAVGNNGSGFYIMNSIIGLDSANRFELQFSETTVTNLVTLHVNGYGYSR